MITRLGWGVTAGGVALYAVSRWIGSPNLHIVGLGIAVLPLAASSFLRWGRSRIAVSRRPTTSKAFPGNRVRVDVTLRNEGRRGTSLILLEDEIPAALGRPARAVLPGIPAGNEQTVGYLVACRRRGRYALGPCRLLLSDPFGLARARVEFEDTDDLVVYPEIEDLGAWPLARYGSGSGESPAHQLFRSGEELYGMRPYVTGDDLRRIHWPSTARIGELIIRQDESARRSSATILLDTRASGLGAAGAPPFERAVSVAASLAVLFARAGYALRLATPDAGPAPLGEEGLLEQLAAIGPSRTVSLAPALSRLRGKTIADATLVVVGAPPSGAESAALIRAGSGYGPKLAAFVYPVILSSTTEDGREELVGRATTARASMARSGWDVFVLGPDRTLAELWNQRRTKPFAAVSSS